MSYRHIVLLLGEGTDGGGEGGGRRTGRRGTRGRGGRMGRGVGHGGVDVEVGAHSPPSEEMAEDQSRRSGGASADWARRGGTGGGLGAEMLLWTSYMEGQSK
jgi:hypothetical protein